MTSELEKKVLVGLGLASVIIAGVTVVYHASTERLVESAGRVSETHALIENLGEFEDNLQAARMEARGYAMTGDRNTKQLYNQEKRDTLSALAQLRDTPLGDSWERTELTEIEKLAMERLQKSDELVADRDRTGTRVSAERAESMYLAATQDAVRSRVARLMSEAREQLNDRVALARDNSNAMLWLLGFGAIVEFAFALAAAGVIRRHIRDRTSAVEAAAPQRSDVARIL